MTYVDFLEALLRIGANYPFGEHKAEYPTIESKLYFVIEKLEETYKDGVEQFMMTLEKKDNEMKYPAPMVINEVDDDESAKDLDDDQE